eukprot:scaffold128400_cov75-Phaeocystis_antarctica.AAC.2
MDAFPQAPTSENPQHKIVYYELPTRSTNMDHAFQITSRDATGPRGATLAHTMLARCTRCGNTLGSAIGMARTPKQARPTMAAATASTVSFSGDASAAWSTPLRLAGPWAGTPASRGPAGSR